MNLNLTTDEMMLLLSLTADNASKGEESHTLWVKVSAEFSRRFDEVKASERFKREQGVA